MELNISLDVPFSVNSYVYRLADLQILQEHASSYSDLVKYKVLGYEINVYTSDAGMTNSVGRVIIQAIQIGDIAIEGARDYVYHELLTEETSELAERIETLKSAVIV